MKKIIYILPIIALISCNWKTTNKNQSDTPNTEAKIVKNELQKNTISTKKFYRVQDSLILDYKYPYLNGASENSFQNFNSFIKNIYLGSENSIQKILKNDELSCDPLVVNAIRKKRNIDYKVYAKNDQFISILLYKTNHYDNTDHNSYMFNGLNYDLKTNTFITYSDVFKGGNEQHLLEKLNQELQKSISEKDSFMDCWKLTADKFEIFKNNFVIDSKLIKFYFDDCTICPTYSGNYFLEIPLEQLKSILKTENYKIPYVKS